MVNSVSYRTDRLNGKLSPKFTLGIDRCRKCGKPAEKNHWIKRKGLCPDCWIEKTARDSLGLIEPDMK